MKDPDKNAKAVTLFRGVKSTNALHRAWHHVRKSAIASSNAQIRQDAVSFEEDLVSRLTSIQVRLSRGTFRFQPYLGALKDRKRRLSLGKAPRPVAIPSIETRVVQRAILNVLQSPPGSGFSKQLGNIPTVNSSEFSVGGVVGGGVELGIAEAISAINRGYRHYYKSDIEAFFTRVPTSFVANYVRENTQDHRFSEIFEAALSFELQNKDELKEYARLFPHDGIGVAQGSSLSAFAGNIFLYDFDRQINSHGVRMFRYIDDVIILAKDAQALGTAVRMSNAILREYEMKLYDPKASPDKASSGLTSNGFEFLGCSIRGARVSPSSEACKREIKKVQSEVQFAKVQINKYMFEPALARNAELAFCQTLKKIDDSLRSWAKSFSFVSDRLPFAQMDREISKLIFQFENWFLSAGGKANEAQKRRAYGVYLLGDTEIKPVTKKDLQALRLRRNKRD